MTFQDLLDQLSEAAQTSHDKGTLFERLIADYLRIDPQYAMWLSDVWLWNEWPDRWSADVGIDLVARESATGEYWAIQCKFYGADHILRKEDIDSFFTASGKRFPTAEGERGFSQRLIVSTTDKWSKHAEEALAHQSIPVACLNFSELADSPIDWSQFSLLRGEPLRLKDKKTLRPHQEAAIAAIKNGLVERGKLIMACGTGKTFTALRLVEETVPAAGKVLFLAPSISLIGQTLREWTAEALAPFHAFAVCSDTKIGREEEDISTHDLAYPATTDGVRLAQVATLLSADRRTVIFSTYQSIDAIIEAQRNGFGAFDLIICDEAHRTTGLTLPGEDPSNFVKVHDATVLAGAKRLYMTATPRIYTDSSKNRAAERNAPMYSMDDVESYGEELYRLGFGEAAGVGLLSDYRVLIVAVRENEMARLANNYNERLGLIDEKTAIDIGFATKIIGSWKGLSKRDLRLIDEQGEADYTEDPLPMQRAVAFSRSIKNSKAATEAFGKLVQVYHDLHQGEAIPGMVDCDLSHVDGTMNAKIRKAQIDWLKADTGGACRILSNARCLSEGIDVPALDAVIFLDTRDSMVDIIQSVGRVMRKSPGKQYGYVILPVCMPSELIGRYDEYIAQDERFKGIWKVIKALRAHDESLVDEAEFRRKIKVYDGRDTGEGDGHGEGGAGETTGLDLGGIGMLPITAIEEAVYAAIPKKLGDIEYWSEWAKSIGTVGTRLIARIESLIASNPAMGVEFDRFLKGLQDTLNPAISHEDAVEMLAQHILTLPVFQALFTEADFPEKNAVGKALQAIVQKLDASAVDSETQGLEEFYDNIRARIALAKSDKSKQDIIRNLYDTFFQNAFPRMAERLGIVYTPVEVVDFILHSVQVALGRHFGVSLASPDVHILDPFSGTGTFPVRLIQSGLIDRDKLPAKYADELHANEIVLLAYYIASINIETAYHAATGEYRSFEGMVLADTFQMTERGDLVDKVVLPENSAKAERQLAQPIRVIVGNPPYSVGQASANDNNQNMAYPTLDGKIRNTYAARSSATNKNSLYDSYIRAIRWASDRISTCGIVAFVTNGAFIDSNTADGLRKCLTEEFSHLYVFNLRGNQRTAGEESKQEGGKIFGSGSRAPIAITIMVKDLEHKGPHELLYHDIGDYLSREDKLKIISEAGSIGGINWQRLRPNEAGDWINQRDPLFETFMRMGDKADAETIFSVYSNGVKTQRDAWAYNSSRMEVETNMLRMIEAFNDENDRYLERCQDKPKEKWPQVDDVINTDPRRISWTRALKADARRGKVYKFESSSLRQSMYRPFNKQWLYFNRRFNEMVYQMPTLFPTSAHRNVVISCTGVADRKGFSVLATDHLPSMHLTDTGQCFPLYWYEKSEAPALVGDMFDAPGGGAGQPVEHGYIQHDAITDWALNNYRKHYRDETIGKEDIFWYVYGVLHAQDYKTRFAADLKKRLPRIPFAGDFWVFSRAGKALAKLHLGYESAAPYPLIEEKRGLDIDPRSFYHVTKMTFGKKDGKPDKSVIVYNANLTLRDIPLDAYEYVVNGKSAVAWIMERYQIIVDKESGIKNDPNDGNDPGYIVDLLKRIVTVSVETVKIVRELPLVLEISP